ncbi:hypothetical protein MWU52_04550 [Jannaschia sp. S6380]|uniref:hypothetical protein n=1 Tax=Jannaschia sp. S6380 TaxID=2926408 RepID=UPI001FF53E9F|nr:hypothetical protein [Jannaschia sp. S6380]MCK0166815.1 hypothetical protein [Jannaschia sp. S6380]
MLDRSHSRSETAISRSRKIRETAADIADARGPLPTIDNGEKAGLQPPVTAFHKGLPHDGFGRPDPVAFQGFLDNLEGPENAEGYAEFDVALGPVDATQRHRPAGHAEAPGARTTFASVLEDGAPTVRNWESPLAGHQGDLQGPAPSELAMAPAPRLGDSELCAELAEVYAMAVLRDTHFVDLANPAAPARGGVTVGEVTAELAGLPWFDPNAPVQDQGTTHEATRRTGRGGPVDGTTLFRGSTEGARVGPYVSQFMLIGTAARGVSPGAKDARNVMKANIAPAGGLTDGAEDGYIVFGAQRIDQRINAQREGVDHLTDWPIWLDAQNGADLRGLDLFESDLQPRFVGRLRDMATYVHFDELYQAYFNACLLMFVGGVPFDHGFPSGRAHPTRGSFATFGGPHILSLMTEVASRALKAVRHQKFQRHLRGRPEQLAAMVTLAANGHGAALGNAAGPLEAIHAELKERMPKTLAAIHAINTQANAATAADPHAYPRVADASCATDLPDISAHNLLLPMAFPEGSPMHAAYGAGHATVAGACVTILKAFFELSTGRVPPAAKMTGQPLTLEEAKSDAWWQPSTMDSLAGIDRTYRASADRLSLEDAGTPPGDLTITGELDKLAANISIGRNMAGVHYYTDYYDSLRMGERLAVGILQEQALTYSDPMSMRLTSFDGDCVIVHGGGDCTADVHVRRPGGEWQDYREEWWARHAGGEFAPTS